MVALIRLMHEDESRQTSNVFTVCINRIGSESNAKKRKTAEVVISAFAAQDENLIIVDDTLTWNTHHHRFDCGRMRNKINRKSDQKSQPAGQQWPFLNFPLRIPFIRCNAWPILVQPAIREWISTWDREKIEQNDSRRQQQTRRLIHLIYCYFDCEIF